jgi:hypothetical protein
VTDEEREAPELQEIEAIERLYLEQEERVYAALRAAGLGPPFHVRYSAYQERPGDNLDEVAFEGRGIVVEHPDEFWGGKEAELYFSSILTNPTWLELCVIAEQQIRTTNDKHHVFLEAVAAFERPDLLQLADAFDPDGDVKGYRLFLGS